MTFELQKPAPSASGKTLLVYSTAGVVRGGEIVVDGKPLNVNLNAWISK